MNERIKDVCEQAKAYATESTKDFTGDEPVVWMDYYTERFTKLIVKECIDKIETYRIPVGNSAAGEMACEWTYDALKEIRDEIKEHFGVKE